MDFLKVQKGAGASGVCCAVDWSKTFGTKGRGMVLVNMYRWVEHIWFGVNCRTTLFRNSQRLSVTVRRGEC